MAKKSWRNLLGTLVFCAIVARPLEACTIFVLTDSTRTLFCNNEDYSNTKTKIWFVPSGENYFGCAYVGFDDGWAQGGVNTEGLAYDWVAGASEAWKRGWNVKQVRGNPSQRMLESCSTVQEAIHFFRKHWEPSFKRARIFIADRSGASAIIGARNGKLFVQEAIECRAFGYAQQTAENALAVDAKPLPERGLEILRASRQEGEFPTQYSTVWDLKTGALFVLPRSDGTEPGNQTRFDLAAELKKGGHYYDLPQLREQIGRDQQPLPPSMTRFYLDTIRAVPDREQRMTRLVERLTRDAAKGKIHEKNYSSKLWQELSSQREAIQKDLGKFGRFKSATLVGSEQKEGQSVYLYKLKFRDATILQRYIFDQNRKLTFSGTEGFEFTADALERMD